MINISSIKDFILDLVFPNRCIMCDCLTYPFNNICDDCLNKLPWICGTICPICGMDSFECNCVSSGSNYFNGVFAPLYYENVVIDCLHRYKFNGYRNYYKELSYLLYHCFSEQKFDFEFDCITCIPMTVDKVKSRTFNQSELLAEKLSKYTGIDFIPDLLVKLYDTESQHLCNKIERSGNLFGVFDVNKNYDVYNKNILIIDDIKTSGNTLNECSKMLYLNGCANIYCEAVAIVKNIN